MFAPPVAADPLDTLNTHCDITVEAWRVALFHPPTILPTAIHGRAVVVCDPAVAVGNLVLTVVDANTPFPPVCLPTGPGAWPVVLGVGIGTTTALCPAVDPRLYRVKAEVVFPGGGSQVAYSDPV